MIFEQIAVGRDNFAYLIADEKTREAIVVDPSFEPEKVLERAKQLNLDIKFLINTHSHHDHINGNDYILENTDAKLIKNVDEIKSGNTVIKIIATPGHTEDSICILVTNKLLTGDTLFVNDVGFTRRERDAHTQFASLEKIIALGDDIEIYPGHDYGATPSSTIGYEKAHSPCIIAIGKNDFAKFLAEK